MLRNLWTWWAEHWTNRQRTLIVILILGPLSGLGVAVLLPPDVMQFRSFLVGYVAGAFFAFGFALIMFAMATPPPAGEKGEDS